MTESAPLPASPKKKRRGRLRRWSRNALIVLLLLVVFHRPLIRFVAIQIAARQHLALDFRLSGTLLTNLTVENLRVGPNGSARTPVEKIAIDKLRLEYSLPMLLRNGPGEFVRSYEVHHADLVFVALPSRTEGEKREKITLAQQLQAIFGQPAAYADRVEIEDFSIRVRARTNETVVEGVDLLLEPDRVGHLRVRRLALPGLPEWKNLNAETSYTSRNLFIKNLVIAPQLVLHDINYDASQRARHISSAQLNASLFGGELSLETHNRRLLGKGENLAHTYDVRTHITARGINVREAAAYFGLKNLPVESLGALDVDFGGEPEKPRTWKGHSSAVIERVAGGPLKIERVTHEASVSNGVATATVEAGVAGNVLNISANAALPATVNELAATPVNADVIFDGSKLAELGETLGLAEPMGGAASLTGKLALRDRTATADLRLTAKDAAFGKSGAESATITLTATKHLDQPALDGLEANVDADIAGLRAGTFALDAAHLHGSLAERLVTLKDLEIVRADNALHANGTYRIPTDLKDAAKAPVDAQFTLHAPNLAAFGVEIAGRKLAGRIEGGGGAKLTDGALAGSVNLDGAEIGLGGFAIESLGAKIKIADGTAQIDDLTLKIDATNRVTLSGKVGVEKPFAYDATLRAALPTLAAFQPLLEVFGVKEPLAGALDIRWAGNGDAAPARHAGELGVELAKARYGKTDIGEFKLAGTYGPDFAKSSEFRIASGITKLAGQIDFGEGKLRLRDLDVEQGKIKVLTGYIIVPLDLQNAQQRIPLGERIAMNINTTDLDIDKLLASFGATSPVSGTVTASIVGGGTPANPVGQFQVKARSLKARAAPQFDNAELDLTLHYSNKRLELAATARQREIQPLSLTANVPLDIEKTLHDKAYDPALPIDVRLKLPPSSLANVPKFVPAVRRIEGTTGLDLRVGGTFGKPDIQLALDVDLKGARMAAENVPAIGAFRAKVAYANEVLSFPAFSGEVGGGTFKLGGTVKFPELDQLAFGPAVVIPKKIEPIFDLKLESKEVLAMRDDSIAVRADTDLKLAGPLKAAAATGTITIVNSRFSKEIDILPIGLPGRPKPAPKSAPSHTDISFPNPPLRDWKFDIAIKTRDDDPFLIRGNLANGAVALALRFAGTGLKPFLDGNVRIERFNASLPFSTLSISRGFVYFKEDEPFQPTLDIQAESHASDYLVSAYIYGSASNPQISLSSEPPLPHADIVSLLATGATTADLGKNAEVIASRAAMLAVKQLYQKMFKHGGTPPPTTAKTGDGNLMQRFQMEMGATDNRSGRQQIIARYKINDQFYLVGDAGVDGQFTGRLKYLIRFR